MMKMTKARATRLPLSSLLVLVVVFITYGVLVVNAWKLQPATNLDDDDVASSSKVDDDNEQQRKHFLQAYYHRLHHHHQQQQQRVEQEQERQGTTSAFKSNHHRLPFIATTSSSLKSTKKTDDGTIRSATPTATTTKEGEVVDDVQQMDSTDSTIGTTTTTTTTTARTLSSRRALNSPITYHPGSFTRNTILEDKNGYQVTVCDGLTGMAIAYSGECVEMYGNYDNNDNGDGGDNGDNTRIIVSNIPFHGKPDAGATFVIQGGLKEANANREKRYQLQRQRDELEAENEDIDIDDQQQQEGNRQRHRRNRRRRRRRNQGIFGEQGWTSESRNNNNDGTCISNIDELSSLSSSSSSSLYPEDDTVVGGDDRQHLRLSHGTGRGGHANSASGVGNGNDGTYLPFYYVSNAEVDANDGGGGVYTLEFDSYGNVIDYFTVLTNTSKNCGGGRTPWNTWVSCEEDDDVGYVWQVDPAGIRTAEKTVLVDETGDWESFAYYLDTVNRRIEFFVTHDAEDGALVRYVPPPDNNGVVFDNLDWNLLHDGNGGKRTYLKLISNDLEKDPFNGTFEWVTNKDEANPEQMYQNVEGIDIVDNMMYFVSKEFKALYVLNLTSQTFHITPTTTGAFDEEPDQVQRLLSHNEGSDKDGNNGILYFCEDGDRDCGLHGRDSTNQFFSLISGSTYKTETTGVAFSPDGMILLLSFQGNDDDEGVIWKFWREDGYPFNGAFLDIKYHEV